MPTTANVALDAVSPIATDQLAPLSVDFSMRYPVIGAPPSIVGVAHWSIASPAPAVAVNGNGKLARARGVAVATALAAPEPQAVIALTRT